MADKEAFAVVIGVDEPAGNIVGGVAADLTGRRVVHIDALYSDAEVCVPFLELDVGFNSVLIASDGDSKEAKGLLVKRTHSHDTRVPGSEATLAGWRHSVMVYFPSLSRSWYWNSEFFPLRI